MDVKDLLKKGRMRYPDIITPLIEEMNILSDDQIYEEAGVVLERIKEELKRPGSNFPFEIVTIKDVNDLVTSHSIRLNSENYKFSEFLGLLTNVYNRKDEIQGMKYSDVDRQREVVAEEMVCLGMTVSETRKGKKPNRRFLDIANQINPSVACQELKRREKVKMWKAIESGKKEDIEKVRDNLRKLKGKE